ncbi:hypothetical protein evm_005144 [Chilo suppressalis]|nr:hypothetical protein evm_005144 [Chilo suppressalis]
MESRVRASPEQLSTLLEFMESHGGLARPLAGAQGRVRSDRLWTDLTNMLNAVGGGVNKTTDKWKKVWADWKSKTKKKGLIIRSHARGTGGGPASRQILSALDERVLAIMGPLAVEGQASVQELGFNCNAWPSSARKAPPLREAAMRRAASLTKLQHSPLDAPAPPKRLFTNWDGYRSALETALDSPDCPLPVSPDCLDSTEKIGGAINTLTTLVNAKVKENSREVAAPKRKLPLTTRNLIQAKNAAPESETLSHPRIQGHRESPSATSKYTVSRLETLMADITPSHLAYYKIAKALRSDATTHTPPLTRPDGTVAFDDDEKAECFADSIAEQCTPSTQTTDPHHIRKVE